MAAVPGLDWQYQRLPGGGPVEPRSRAHSCAILALKAAVKVAYGGAHMRRWSAYAGVRVAVLGMVPKACRQGVGLASGRHVVWY